MNQPKNLSSFGVGLAIFSMFFGAGNSIFPVYIGYISKNLWYVAILGLILTAVLMPILGIFGMLRSHGDPSIFFSRLGKVPGFIVAFIVISLLGPLGSTPRCVALSFATLIPVGTLPISFFALAACALIFICALKKAYILPIIGYVLTPILMISLGCIIFSGLIFGHFESASIANKWPIFYSGLSEGYKTMDLLAAIFFSSTIFHLLRGSKLSKENSTRMLMNAGLIAGALLALTYGGFCFIAAMHSNALSSAAQEQLLARLAEILLGSKASVVVKIAIALACLTTAVALITAFTDFMQTKVFKRKVKYYQILAGSLLLTYCISIFEFAYISEKLSPILKVLYPILIVLTLINCFFAPKKQST
ncbi:MAG: Branched-chain amino acid transport system 2 carrier protein [Chlamydiae bacterium]|nr:Branched-chain amino acid transport system 2 carrier protein [Chlamydiota bacterium]